MNRLLNWLFPRYVDPFEAAGIERPKPVRVHILGFSASSDDFQHIQAAANRLGTDATGLVDIAVREFLERHAETGNRCHER